MADSADALYTVVLPYIGGRYWAIMPSDGFIYSIKYKIWGGGGGGGGNQDRLPGGYGAAGGFMDGSIRQVRPGQLIEVFVGQGGGTPANGKSLTGHSGGYGAAAGPYGASGNGGGGGGATAIRIDGQLVVIVGGGGGAGGGGQYSPGENAGASVTYDPAPGLTFADIGKGIAGQSPTLDGGGCGGGGGGNVGGSGGLISAGYYSPDIGGTAGSTGSNGQGQLPPREVGVYSSGVIPGGTSDPSYPGSNVAYGGSPGGFGGHGHAVLTFYRTSNIFVKKNGAFERVRPRIKGSGNVYAIRAATWVKVSGTWRTVNNDIPISFSQDSVDWGDNGLPAQVIQPPMLAPYGDGGGGDGSSASSCSSSDSGGCSAGDGGGGGGGGGCFLTTATVSAMGLPDDCEELELARMLRDTYMTSESDSRAVALYDYVAPIIVANKTDGWASFYQNVTVPVTSLIKMREYDLAVKLYKLATLELIDLHASKYTDKAVIEMFYSSIPGISVDVTYDTKYSMVKDYIKSKLALKDRLHDAIRIKLQNNT